MQLCTCSEGLILKRCKIPIELLWVEVGQEKEHVIIDYTFPHLYLNLFSKTTLQPFQNDIHSSHFCR